MGRVEATYTRFANAMVHDVVKNGGVEDCHADGMDSGFDAPWDEFRFTEDGIDPRQPSHARPGSDEKVMTLAARYAAGVPLWHERDCFDHAAQKAEQNGSESSARRNQHSLNESGAFEDDEFDEADARLLTAGRD